VHDAHFAVEVRSPSGRFARNRGEHSAEGRANWAHFFAHLGPFFVNICTIAVRGFGATTQAFSAGTIAGAGSFRCLECGFAVALQELDEIPSCPHCGGSRFRRSSMFGDHNASEPWGGGPSQHPDWVAEARDALTTAGDYLVYRDGERLEVIEIQDGWSRLGRSLAAHVRFDDPTVSRRHALIHREDDVVRVLDDRSLNGLFVNGERVEWQSLEDGDELLMGRFHIYFMRLTGAGARERSDRVDHSVA